MALISISLTSRVRITWISRNCLRECIRYRVCVMSHTARNEMHFPAFRFDFIPSRKFSCYMPTTACINNLNNRFNLRHGNGHFMRNRSSTLHKHATPDHLCVNVIFSCRGHKSSNWVFVPDSLTSILKFPRLSLQGIREFYGGGEKRVARDPIVLCCLHIQSRRGETNLNPKLSWASISQPC